MRTLPVVSLLALPACLAPWGGPPSDDLDKSWKEDIAANHIPSGEGTDFTGVPVEDPTGIEGTYSILTDGGDCLVRYDLDGVRADCSSCDYAFEVELDVSLDNCGMGDDDNWTTRFEFRRDRLYVNERYVASFTVDGAWVEWSGSGYTGYYDYYYYYYGGDYGSTTYYGSALLLR